MDIPRCGPSLERDSISLPALPRKVGSAYGRFSWQPSLALFWWFNQLGKCSLDRLSQSSIGVVQHANRIGVGRVRVLLPLSELERVLDHHPAPFEAARHELL